VFSDRRGRDVIRRVLVLAGLSEVARPNPVRLDLVGAHVDEVDELGVRDVAVVALKEVVDHVLPVAPHVVGQPLRQRQLGDIWRPPLDLQRQIARLLAKRPSGGIEVDVDEPAELLHLHLIKADPRLVERLHPVGTARTPELPVETVDPRVVRADDASSRSRPRQQLVCPVLADVVERAQHADPIAHNRDRHPRDRRRHIATRRSQLLHVAHPLPGAGEDRRHLRIQPLLLRIGIGTQRHRTRRIAIKPTADLDHVIPTDRHHPPKRIRS